MADAGSFFARWSRLKREARAPQAADEGTKTAAAPAADTPPAELPPLESLTAESDYKIFMQPGVSDVVRNAALRKLWRSDPVFANLDGLVEYGEDYAAAFKASAAVRTAYRVAQGMTEDEPPAAEPVRPAQPPTAPASNTPSQTDACASTAKDGSDVHENRAVGWTDAESCIRLTFLQSDSLANK